MADWAGIRLLGTEIETKLRSTYLASILANGWGKKVVVVAEKIDDGSMCFMDNSIMNPSRQSSIADEFFILLLLVKCEELQTNQVNDWPVTGT